MGWDRVLAFAQSPILCLAVLVATALLLVSTLPVWSFKNFKVPAEYVLPMLLGIGLQGQSACAQRLAEPDCRQGVLQGLARTHMHMHVAAGHQRQGMPLR